MDQHSAGGRLAQIGFPAIIVLVITVMILPLPSSLLDLLIVANISTAVLILLVSTNVKRALDFSSFPSLLLVVTLVRIGLNVSTSRAVLSRGDAGGVIATFGSFVVGGNIVVGFVIFLIITLVQFVVISNGSGRVAEVSARFTLDAMPGKQMAIDADLNAGMLSDEEAKLRRMEVAEEADFYGAMDGASKFVKGDAIAGLVITLVNLIGGLVIGVMQLGMPIGEAVSTLQPADRRRRPRGADPGIARVDLVRSDRHPFRQAARTWARPCSASSPARVRRSDRAAWW